MTIKAIKEKYKGYELGANEKNCFVVVDYQDGNGKVVVVVNSHHGRYIGKYVRQVVRVSDGEELLKTGRARPCDNLADAVDVAWEMLR